MQPNLRSTRFFPHPGLDLIRRVEGRGGAVAHALTVPLVVKSDGAKFGKTAGGAIWLDATMTSPYAFYQFWLNTDDRDVVRFLRLFSLRSPAEIEEIVSAWDDRRASRSAQRALADELTSLIHGADETARVIAAGKALFGHGDLDELDVATLDAALAEAPHVVVADGEPLPTVVELLVATGLCESKGAARRAVQEGGAYLDNVRVLEPDTVPQATLAGGWVLLRKGVVNYLGKVLVEKGADGTDGSPAVRATTCTCSWRTILPSAPMLSLSWAPKPRSRPAAWLISASSSRCDAPSRSIHSTAPALRGTSTSQVKRASSISLSCESGPSAMKIESRASLGSSSKASSMPQRSVLAKKASVRVMAWEATSAL